MSLAKISEAFDNFLDTKYNALNIKVKVGILIAVWALPIIVFYLLFASPKHKQINQLHGSINQLNKEITQLEAQTRELPKYQAEKDQVEKLFKAASEFLPQQKEIPSLLTSISAEGTNSGLDFVSFNPKGEAPVDFYASIPVDIQVEGPYHNVGVFLDKINKLPRIVSVSNINMGSPKRTGNEMILSTRFSLVTYRFIEPSDDEQNKAKK